MRTAAADLPPPDPSLHQTGSEGTDGNRGERELVLLRHFGLTPSADLLDVGCGIGRLAYQCASYLDDGGTYTGLDIEPSVIEWLTHNYASRLHGFRFDLLDVHSERYRPDGAVDPSAVRLPYPDASFDVVCAFEVFMHVPPDGIRNYINEFARVLRAGGVAVMTLIVMHPGERNLAHHGQRFVQVGEGVYTKFPKRQSISMAYDIALVRPMIGDAGLEEFGFIKGEVHTPIPWRSKTPKPLWHPCDLFAVRKPG